MTEQQVKRLKKALTDFHRVSEAETRIQELIEEGLELEQRQETTP